MAKNIWPRILSDQQVKNRREKFQIRLFNQKNSPVLLFSGIVIFCPIWPILMKRFGQNFVDLVFSQGIETLGVFFFLQEFLEICDSVDYLLLLL